MNYKLFDTREELNEFFTEYFIDAMKFAGNKKFNVALSGGSSPKWYLPALAEKNIDWNKILLFQIDERCVSPANEQSNYRMLRDVLFKKINMNAKNFYRMKGEGEPDKEAEAYGRLFEEKNIFLDMAILGMGSDGHTASVFPGQEYLFNYKNITGVQKFPSSEQNRITLTLDTINKSGQKVFILEGEDKEEALKEIFVNNNKADLPAGRIKGNVLWLLNKNAAKFLIK